MLTKITRWCRVQCWGESDKPLVVCRKYPEQVWWGSKLALYKYQMIECFHIHVFVHSWICIHSLPWVPYGVKKKKAPVLANKHLCIVDFSAMILLFNLSAFDSKPLEAIISDKWKLYMKINIKSFVREKITLLGNKQGIGLRAMLPVIHISTAFKLLKRLEIIIGHIFFPFFSTQMARLRYLTFTSGL